MRFERVKKMYSMLLASAVVVCSVFPGTSVSAQELTESEVTSEGVWENVKADNVFEGYSYQELQDGTLEITGYSGNDTELVIPGQIDGKSVTSIGRAAFLDCSSLTSVAIPDSVTGIGELAFSGCSSLTDITIPKSVIGIHWWAFNGCSNLEKFEVDTDNENFSSEDGILYTKDKTSVVRCPEGKSGTVTIPNSVTNIGAAFMYCSKLTNVTIPDSVTDIQISSFCGCSSLTSIVIPRYVEYIGQGAFSDCSSLEKLEVDPNNRVYSSENDILYKNYNVICCAGGKKGNVTISESATGIGPYAFEGCNSLTGIFIPESVTDISIEAFIGCSSLEKLEVSPNNENYFSENNLLYDKDKRTLFCCPEGTTGDITIPDSVTSIENNAFRGCSKLTSVTIPSGLRSIGYSVFSGCSSLTVVTIPESVISIEYGAFSGCSNLISVTIPSGLRSIGNSAFSGCSSLTDVTIPESVISIGNYVFEGCNSLTLRVFPGSDAEDYAKENNIKYVYAGECAFHDYTSVITKQSSCTEAGVKTFTCTKCGGTYTEEIPATGHSYTSKTTKATTVKNGSITETCSVCSDKRNSATIYAAKTVSLSKTAYTYNKKVQKPSVTVKDSRGKALKANTDYTVSYPKDMKNVGSYTVTISFKGNYSGTVKKTFTIAPKGTEISKVTGKKKGFTLKWKKQSEQTTGYEIAYSTEKNFKKAATATITIGKTKTISKSVIKLAVKKTHYYVKIRTYKTVKVNGKSTKIYSAWSKVKKVTTKK